MSGDWFGCTGDFVISLIQRLSRSTIKNHLSSQGNGRQAMSHLRRLKETH